MSDIEDKIVAEIKARIGRNERIFFPESFAGICSPEEARTALEGLASADELEIRAQVYSSGGHICFDGALSELDHDNEWPPFMCCGKTLERKDAALYFVIPRQRLHPKAEEYIRPREALEKLRDLSDRKELREMFAIANEALDEGPNEPKVT